MARKANIIKHLNMMGYSVLEDNGIYSVSLRTGDGLMFVAFVPEEDLLYKDFIVEDIVRHINGLIAQTV